MAQRRAQLAVRVHHRHHDRCRRQVHDREAAPEDEGVAVADQAEHGHEDADADDADGVHRRADSRVLGAGAQPVGPPHHRQGASAEEAREPREGVVVERRVVGGSRLVGDRHHQRRRHRHAGGRDEQRPLPHPGDGEGEDQRPEDVELLLHGEGPQVLEQRGTPGELEVRLLVDELPPVVDVQERRHDIAAQPRDRVGGHDGGEEDHHGEHAVERREQPAGPAQPELAKRDPTLTSLLADEQRRDQVAADQEEDLDAEEAPRHEGHRGVVEDHGEHRDRAKSVDAPEVREVRRGGRPLQWGRGGSRGHGASGSEELHEELDRAYRLTSPRTRRGSGLLEARAGVGADPVGGATRTRSRHGCSCRRACPGSPG